MKYRLVSLVTLAINASAAAQALCPEMPSEFLFVEKIARGSPAQQANNIPYLYRMYFELNYRMKSASPFGDSFPLSRAEYLRLTPEQIAEKFTSEALKEYTERRTLELMRNHPTLVYPLIKKDLGSTDKQNLLRALIVARSLGSKEYLEPVLALFQSAKDNDIVEHAACTLEFIDDPRAITPMLGRRQNCYFFEHLRFLQRSRTPAQALLQLLSSPNADVRWKAVYALAESGDSSLVPYVKKLLQDPDKRVRVEAVSMAANLKVGEFPHIRPSLLKLLSDPAMDVRFYVATLLADRKDKVCANALLQLVKDKSLQQWQYTSIIEAMEHLTGTYVDYKKYDYRTYGYSATPGTPANLKLIDYFAEWVEHNQAHE